MPRQVGFEPTTLRLTAGCSTLFAGLLALVAAAHFLTRLPDAILFWAAYVLTRPLGATLGDTVTKAPAEGGLGLGRISSSLAIAVVMVIGIVLTSRPGGSAGPPGRPHPSAV